eukprot:GILJ01002648.1.p1 GENE.GILJ01002648.1~~GILJ01002648.1.p1  ORF type:complete len:439 (-),score=56.64 GILJ01002648.1:109-1425(-)
MSAEEANVGKPDESAPLTENGAENVRKQWSHRALGLLLLACVVCLWVSASTVIQTIFDEVSFKKPFFVTYTSTSLFSIYLLPWHRLSSFFSRIFGRRQKNEDGDDEAPLIAVEGHHLDAVSMAASGQGSSSTSEQTVPGSTKLSLKETARLAVQFCPFWFVANWLFNFGLLHTSVSSNTILSTTSSLFTLLLSTIFLREPLFLLKFAAVLLSFSGVVQIALADGESSGHHFLGDGVTLISAFMYATYTTMLKARIPNEEAVDMSKFLGFVGLTNMLCLWPLFFIFDAVGLESHELPTGEAFMFLALNALFGTVLSDYLWARSVLLLSPVISTVGLTMTIPLAMLSDVIFKDKAFSWRYLLGTLCTFGGFLLVSSAENIARRKNPRLELCFREWSCRNAAVEHPGDEDGKTVVSEGVAYGTVVSTKTVGSSIGDSITNL